MPDYRSLPSFDAIVVAAGEGLRAGRGMPKQFARWRGKPLLLHSIERLQRLGAARLVVVHPPGSSEAVADLIAKTETIIFATGGSTRQQSVRSGLHALADNPSPYVLIHDAARPDIVPRVVERLLSALADQDGAVPVLPVSDSLARGANGLRAGAVERAGLYRVQTPQAFRYCSILQAHDAWKEAPDASDDADVLHAAGGQVALVDGDERLRKLTYSADFEETGPPMRVGTGYDVHRLGPDTELWLGGIRIDYEQGLIGHSDADVALHAITDALLGAVGDGDIGTHFPPSDPQWKGAASDAFLRHAVGLVEAMGYDVGNIDLTIICEAPKIGPYRAAMRQRIAEIIGVDLSAISIKATTTEQLGFTGRSEGIAAQAVATVFRHA